LINLVENIISMTRSAFKMFLKPGLVSEYAKRHNTIWPELKKNLKENGICDYSIFFDKDTNTLFAFQENRGSSSSQDMGTIEIVGLYG